MKITLYLLGEKGYQVLRTIINDGWLNKFKISVVYAQDIAIENDYSSNILNLCNINDIHVSKRGDQVNGNGADYVFAIGWRWLVNLEAKQTLIVLHDSILPKYRGFSPLVNAALNKDKYIGVTALFASDKYDEGDVIAIEKMEVNYPIRISLLIKQVSNLYVKLIRLIFNKLADNVILTGQKQNHKLATYSIWLDDEDYYVDWTDSASNIAHKINLLGSPYSHAKAHIDGKTVYLQEASVCDYALERFEGHFGKVILLEDGCPVVICGKGQVKLLKISSLTGEELLPLSKFRVRFH